MGRGKDDMREREKKTEWIGFLRLALPTKSVSWDLDSCCVEREFCFVQENQFTFISARSY